jgi:uncharacterized membrane protein YeaQ/YmgE (transglycosylase-associated protein family)
MLPLALSAAGTVVAVIVLIIAGLIVGALGRLIHPGPDPMGLIATAAIGVASLLIAGLLLPRAIGWLGYLVAVLIAVALVALVSGHRRRRARR